jgi:hypothetical protein
MHRWSYLYAQVVQGVPVVQVAPIRVAIAVPVAVAEGAGVAVAVEAEVVDQG